MSKEMPLAMRGYASRIGRLGSGEHQERKSSGTLTCETGKGQGCERVVVVVCDVKEIECGVVDEVGAGEGEWGAGGAGVLDNIGDTGCCGSVEGKEDAVVVWEGQSGCEEMHGWWEEEGCGSCRGQWFFVMVARLSPFEHPQWPLATPPATPSLLSPAPPSTPRQRSSTPTMAASSASPTFAVVFQPSMTSLAT